MEEQPLRRMAGGIEVMPSDSITLGQRLAVARMVKLLELVLLLEVRPLASPTLRLVFRPAFMDTHRE